MKHFYQKYETQIKALAAAPMVFVALYFTSRSPTFSCDNYAKGFKDLYECHLILSHKSTSGGIAYLFVKDLYRHQSTDVQDGSKWISENFDKFLRATPLLKRKANTLSS